MLLQTNGLGIQMEKQLFPYLWLADIYSLLYILYINSTVKHSRTKSLSCLLTLQYTYS